MKTEFWAFNSAHSRKTTPPKASVAGQGAVRVLLLCVFSCLVLGELGCRTKSESGDSSPEARGKINAVVTVGMVADLVREIGGEQVAVNQLLGSGVDPHLYKPNRDDVQKILQADIVFYSGLLLEGKMTDALEKVGKSKTTVAVAEGIPPSEIDRHAGAQGHPDPHVWMDVSMWRQAAAVVAEAMAEFDPDHSGEYATRCLKLQERLARLHQYGKDIMQTVPESSQVLITSHDAFSYFGRAYGLEVEPVQGISTESEAGLQRINQLVDMIVDRKIPSVFVESSVPKDSIMALIRGAESRGATVAVGGTLFSDAMGEVGTYEGTYIGMLDFNLTNVAKGLGGSPPEGGFQAVEEAAVDKTAADQNTPDESDSSPKSDAALK